MIEAVLFRKLSHSQPSQVEYFLCIVPKLKLLILTIILSFNLLYKLESATFGEEEECLYRL